MLHATAAHTALHSATQRWQGLDFDLVLPADWKVLLPTPIAIDFDAEPAAMQPLLQARSTDGSFRLDIGARPFEPLLPLETGAICRLGDLGLERLDDGDPGQIDDHAALIGQALSRAGAATQWVRYAYFADGARLVEIQLRGPRQRMADMLPVWRLVEASLRLHHPQGDPSAALDDVTIDAADPSRSWWDRAQALQQDGRIDEALQLVDRECGLVGGLLAQAELLARHMRESIANGDIAEAARAHARATGLAWAYASSATSGGEGAAMSIERDRFLAQLGPAPRAPTRPPR